MSTGRKYVPIENPDEPYEEMRASRKSRWRLFGFLCVCIMRECVRRTNLACARPSFVVWRYWTPVPF